LKKSVEKSTKNMYTALMKYVSFTLPDEIHARFKEYAQSRRRTIKAQILWMIEEAVKDFEKGLADSTDLR